MTDERIFYLHDFDENGNPTDVKTSIKRTIGQFVGEKAQNSGQKYVIDSDGSQEISGKGLTVEENKVTPPLTKFDGQHQGGAYTVFEEISKTTDGEKLIGIQNSISNYGELEGINLIKGKENIVESDEAMSFQTLLQETNSQNGKVAAAVARKLVQATGHDNDSKIGDTANKEPIPIQSTVGKYEKVDQRFQIELEEYKNIGIKLLLEGSGELIKITDPTNDAQRAAFLAASPLGLARLGTKVPYTNINANSIIKKEHPEFKKETSSKYFGNPGHVNGAPYNPLIVFDGFSNQAQTATCYLIFTALFSTIVTIASTYEALHNRAEARNQKANTNRRFGISRLFGITSAQNGSDNFFGLIETKNDYTECVKKGLKAFFGFGADGSVANARLFINNPGYSSVVLRLIIADTLDVFGNSVLGGLIPGGIPSNNTAPSGVVEGLNQSVGTINKLKNSKLLKFMNVVAHLGDIIVTLNSQDVTADLYFGNTETVQLLTTQELLATSTEQDALNLRGVVTNNRSSANKGSSLSWGTKTTPSAVSYTDTFKRAREAFVSTTNPQTNRAFVEAMNYSSVTPENGVKLNPDVVSKIEGQLGYAYLPFYFHDLRTNEIISFHGFLSDISDAFNTDYESSEGYGRAGAIYHYKNIKRKTSLRFWMVATSKDDFDLMWYKLNRLLAMAQPMYTEGRNISFQDSGKTYKFTQPFSQIPAATPIVRVRVGDLITNNFSELDLARLYGFGNNQSFRISDTNTQLSTLNNEVAQRADQIATARNKFVVGRKLNPIATLYATIPTHNGARGTISTVPPTRRGTATTPGRIPRNVIELKSDATVIIAELGAEQYGLYDVVVSIENQGPRQYTVDGITLNGCFQLAASETSVSSLQATQDLQTTQIAALQASEAAQAEATVLGQGDVNWLKSTPIFKAFENASGEGMLAVIEAIEPSFDMSSTVWEDEPGSVAPKAFEISVSLSPMFDINPGLAADGQMIGAIYRVGRINHGMKALKYKADNTTQINSQASGTGPTSGSPQGENSR